MPEPSKPSWISRNRRLIHLPFGMAVRRSTLILAAAFVVVWVLHAHNMAKPVPVLVPATTTTSPPRSPPTTLRRRTTTTTPSPAATTTSPPATTTTTAPGTGPTISATQVPASSVATTTSNPASSAVPNTS